MVKRKLLMAIAALMATMSAVAQLKRPADF